MKRYWNMSVRGLVGIERYLRIYKWGFLWIFCNFILEVQKYFMFFITLIDKVLSGTIITFFYIDIDLDIRVIKCYFIINLQINAKTLLCYSAKP